MVAEVVGQCYESWKSFRRESLPKPTPDEFWPFKAGFFRGYGWLKSQLAPTLDDQPVALVSEFDVEFLRGRSDGSRWPAGTRLYASPYATETDALDASRWRSFVRALQDGDRRFLDAFLQDIETMGPVNARGITEAFDEVLFRRTRLSLQPITSPTAAFSSNAEGNETIRSAW
ncbi:hypothetical protein [Dyella amyloliquefaciens]|uniref:hypothetical protein n=1 Tax=Dyella amyloliquefaciens TaxID=1770545 RepID=UPI00102EB3BE|nr:hypothetical protein [Dyella amyloliquefaciens]